MTLTRLMVWFCFDIGDYEGDIYYDISARKRGLLRILTNMSTNVNVIMARYGFYLKNYNKPIMNPSWRLSSHKTKREKKACICAHGWWGILKFKEKKSQSYKGNI